MRAPILVALIFAPGLAFAQTADREELSIIGWDDACSVAISHYGYHTLVPNPIRVQIGTLDIQPGKESYQAHWSADLSGDDVWRSAEIETIRQKLVSSHPRPGFLEIVRGAASDRRTALDDILLSTRTFHLRSFANWPTAPWRPEQIHYSPWATCALFVFVDTRVPNPHYRYTLARLYNPAARTTRAHAHDAKALMFLEKSDLENALKESAIAAQMAPLDASSRYHHATMLCLSGSLPEAEAELAEAVKLSPRYKREARTDKNFESLFSSPRFKDITRR